MSKMKCNQPSLSLTCRVICSIFTILPKTFLIDQNGGEGWILLIKINIKLYGTILSKCHIQTKESLEANLVLWRPEPCAFFLSSEWSVFLSGKFQSAYKKKQTLEWLVVTKLHAFFNGDDVFLIVLITVCVYAFMRSCECLFVDKLFKWQINHQHGWNGFPTTSRWLMDESLHRKMMCGLMIRMCWY